MEANVEKTCNIRLLQSEEEFASLLEEEEDDAYFFEEVYQEESNIFMMSFISHPNENFTSENTFLPFFGI